MMRGFQGTRDHAEHRAEILRDNFELPPEEKVGGEAG